MYIKNFKSREFFILCILILSTILGFFLNEDTLGGAKSDFYSGFERTLYFKKDILFYLLNYETLEYRHSPVFFIFSSIIIKLVSNETLYRFIHLLIPVLIFIYFYKSLILKFNDVEKKKLFIISLIIFLSPTIRSYSIWPDSYLFGLLFFTLSIYNYLIFKDDNSKINNSFLNVFFVALSSYFMPTFSLFSIYFFLNYFKIFINNRILISNLIKIILLNILLALPALIYIFYFNIYFLKSSEEWGLYEKTFSLLNLSNKIFFSSNIIFFHLLPFIILYIKSFNIEFIKDNKYKLLLFSILLIVTYFFSDYENIFNNLGGGGIFYQFSKIINFPELQLIIIVPLSFLFISIFKSSIQNYLILVILILSNFQLTIYHNYFEPILYILIFSLVKNKKIEVEFFTKKMILLFIIFNFSYLLINFAK